MHAQMSSKNLERFQGKSTSSSSHYESSGDPMFIPNETGEDDDSVNGGDDDDDEYMENVDDDHSSVKTSLIPRIGELSLSFQGQVYVFSEVSFEKLQAVILLLGGREVPMAGPTADSSFQNNKGVSETRSNHSQRMASLDRFREKREELYFGKKVRYNCRKEVAHRIPRKNGKFVSARESSKEDPVTTYRDSPQSCSQDDIMHCLEIVDHKCENCGIKENSTPVMRRGPAGPRSLCNACGLMWANKGTLRDVRNGGKHISFDQNESEISVESKIATGATSESPTNYNLQVGPNDLYPSTPEIGNCSAVSYEQSVHGPGLVAESLWGDFWDLQGIDADTAISSSFIDQICSESYLRSNYQELP